MTQMQAGSSWRASGGVRGRLVWWRMPASAPMRPRDAGEFPGTFSNTVK
jgi:hypothetical protein